VRASGVVSVTLGPRLGADFRGRPPPKAVNRSQRFTLQFPSCPRGIFFTPPGSSRSDCGGVSLGRYRKA
jgi:hypothetical protein